MNRSLIAVMVAAVSVLSAGIGSADPELTIKPYGYFKLDMAYDTAQTNNGNYTFWVNNKGGGDEDSAFSMTARQTRLGFNLKYIGVEDADVTGKFEIDFYGGGSENKNLPMMRHAYLKVNYGRYYLLAGQTSDVVSPLVPTTVNYIPLWNCGNIGYRHPQLQVGNVTDNGLEVVWALSRNISGDSDLDGIDDGADASLPTVQARFSYLMPGVNVGVSGHYGQMEYVDSKGSEETYASYSVNAHASVIVSDEVSLKGEVFTGQTLNQYLGGIGQGFDHASNTEIESVGGWVSGTYKPADGLSFNAGFGIDQPDKDDKKAFPARNQNRCVFVNAFKEIAHKTTFGLELSHWTTGYWDASGDETDTSDLRAQASFSLSF